MAQIPAPVAAFLRGKRFAVAGVSRDASQPANAIYRKLRDCGYEVLPVNPNATEVEGVACHADVGSLPSPIDGVIIATHPQISADIVRQCADAGVRRVWFHRSIDAGSVSEAALRECEERGIEAIVGGCPLMYCEPVDLGHRCMRWWLGWRGRLPK